MPNMKVPNNAPMPASSLPLRCSLGPAYASSLCIALLVAVSALAGLLFTEAVYPSDEIVLAFLPVDPFHLVVGLPVLLGSMWLARGGHLAALLCWPGALLYILYSYALNLLGVPFGALFLPYLLLVALSAYTTVALVACIDSQAIRQQLSGLVPARAAGFVLVVLTSLFLAIAVAGIVAALAGPEPIGAIDSMLWIVDMAVLSPACLLGGILLLRGKALGYAGATGLLLVYTMLFFGLVPVLSFPALHSNQQIDLAGLVMMIVAGLICLILLILFLRGISRAAGRLHPVRR